MSLKRIANACKFASERTPQSRGNKMLLYKLLETTIRFGTLKVIDDKGNQRTFTGENGARNGPTVAVRLHDKKLLSKLYLNPDLVVGEAYMDGTLTIEEGSLREFLQILAANLQYAETDPLFILRSKLDRLLRGWHQKNPIKTSKKNVHHHYDLPDKLYDLFLDKHKQYSCAYFHEEGDDLETAQEAKQRHLAAKLLLKPGQNILDIGSGWGGLALYLAQEGGGNVTGLTLSKEQLKLARQSASASGLDRVAKFHLRDYRQQTGSFDRIISVGMFEHVGVNQYQQYFATIKRLLKDDGIFVLHSIGRSNPPASTGPFVRKYIFPGGYSPALSETVAQIEKAGLWINDVEILRLHYADTLKAWSERFEARRDEVVELMDERFCRMWEYYLTSSEAAFRYGDHMVFQIQITKQRDAAPLTRDYIVDWESSHPLGNFSLSSINAA